MERTLIIRCNNNAQDMVLGVLVYHDMVDFMANIYDDLKRVQGKQYSMTVHIFIGDKEDTALTYDTYDAGDIRRVIGCILDANCEGRLFREIEK